MYLYESMSVMLPEALQWGRLCGAPAPAAGIEGELWACKPISQGGLVVTTSGCLPVLPHCPPALGGCRLKLQP